MVGAVQKAQSIFLSLNYQNNVAVRFFRVYDSLINLEEFSRLECQKIRHNDEIIMLFTYFQGVDISKVLIDEEQMEIYFYYFDAFISFANMSDFEANNIKKMRSFCSIFIFEGSLSVKFEKDYYIANKLIIDSIMKSALDAY